MNTNEYYFSNKKKFIKHNIFIKNILAEPKSTINVKYWGNSTGHFHLELPDCEFPCRHTNPFEIVPNTSEYRELYTLDKKRFRKIQKKWNDKYEFVKKYKKIPIKFAENMDAEQIDNIMASVPQDEKTKTNKIKSKEIKDGSPCTSAAIPMNMEIDEDSNDEEDKEKDDENDNGENQENEDEVEDEDGSDEADVSEND